MRLELAEFPVKNVRFGENTSYDGGILEISKEELTALILQDDRVISADVDVAFPGDKTRIVNCRDIVEPRVKASGSGCVFPGILGPAETVGDGRTNRLSGVTVMPSAEYRSTLKSGAGTQSSAILDMWGPGAGITPFASLINIVLIFKLRDDVSEWEAHMAIQSAELRVSRRLAEATVGRTAESVEVFELQKVDPSLPRVVYILTCHTTAEAPHSGLSYYGLPIQDSLPALMHPNELLDGALTSDARRGNGGFAQTWSLMNNPVALKLLREHGKQINFLGVILGSTGRPTELGKQGVAAAISEMAQLWGAEDAIITRLTPGNSLIDIMLTVQACARKGIKTVLLIPERGGVDGTELPLIYYVPEATDMISTGNVDREMEIPAPNKVIGVKKGQEVTLYPGDPPIDPWRELRTRQGVRDIVGGIDWFGRMNLTCKEY